MLCVFFSYDYFNYHMVYILESSYSFKYNLAFNLSCDLSYFAILVGLSNSMDPILPKIGWTLRILKLNFKKSMKTSCNASFQGYTRYFPKHSFNFKLIIWCFLVLLARQTSTHTYTPQDFGQD